MYLPVQKQIRYVSKAKFALSPPHSREGLCGDNVQGVPSGDAQAVVKAQHENHHGLTGTKPQEETADARKDHGAA